MMTFLEAFWSYLLLTAPYLLFGMLGAGVINRYLNIKTIEKHLSGKGWGTIIKASAMGVPLPLCSCSVIPAAVTLKKKGASNGATSSFLISTPESGVDSIVMTYGVMDIPMTIMRPIAAFLTATVAGFGQGLFNDFEMPSEETSTGGCCKKNKSAKKTEDIETFIDSIKKVFTFAFGDLANDLAVWLTIGLLVGAAMNAYLPVEVFTNLPDWSERLIVLAFGIPFYICASASTPIAASMMMKGMSPGVALIFLLVGPATNFTNLAVLQKFIGKKGITINIISIALVSLLLSFVVDGVYSAFNLPTHYNISSHNHENQQWYEHLMAILLLILLLKGIYNEKISPILKSVKKTQSGGCH